MPQTRALNELLPILVTVIPLERKFPFPSIERVIGIFVVVTVVLGVLVATGGVEVVVIGGVDVVVDVGVVEVVFVTGVATVIATLADRSLIHS